MSDAYRTAHISEIPEPAYEVEPGDPEWRPVRMYFGITSFGTNAYVARAEGDRLVEEHTETGDSGTRHEELYYVASGRARFTVAGEEVEAPAGTFVYVRDPSVSRTAVADEGGTTVLCFGGAPGEAFAVSPWERKYER